MKVESFDGNISSIVTSFEYFSEDRNLQELEFDLFQVSPLEERGWEG